MERIDPRDSEWGEQKKSPSKELRISRSGWFGWGFQRGRRRDLQKCLIACGSILSAFFSSSFFLFRALAFAFDLVATVTKTM